MVERNMIGEMQRLGLDLAEQVLARITDNTEALETIEGLLDEKILGIGRTVVANRDQLSNEYLTRLAKDMGVDAIHWYIPDCMVTFSAYEIDLGWVAPSTNPVRYFSTSGLMEWTEEIRQAEGNDNFYKYGYVRGTLGEFVQVGILANAVQALTEKFSYDVLVNDLATYGKVVYAAVINKQ